MLRISRDAFGDDVARLRLEGQVTGPWVEELRGACSQATNGTRGMAGLVLDLSGVSFIDSEGVGLFRDLAALGVTCVNCSPFAAEQLKGVVDVDG
jgi:anti-anti-sigma factor